MRTLTHTLANYSLIKLLGSGHFGVVYEAKNRGTNGTVALKIVQTNSAVDADMVLEEAKNISAAANDHTVKINTAFNIHQGGSYLSLIDMPLIRGGTVEDMYKSNRLTMRDIMRLMRHILDGLSGIHSQGIIHKDVKPGNILINKENFILGDFGLAAAANIVPSSNIAYLHHHPPELNQHHVLYDSKVVPCVRYDIYAAGMTLFRLLSPRSHYEVPLGQYNSWCKDPKKKCLPDYIGMPPYIPRKLKTIIKKATSLNLNDRFESAPEMKRAIERLSVNVNWKFPPSLPIWESSSENGSIHRAILRPCKEGYEFRPEINLRKLRGFETVKGEIEVARKAMFAYINSSTFR